MLNVIMLIVVILSAVMLSAILLSVIFSFLHVRFGIAFLQPIGCVFRRQGFTAYKNALHNCTFKSMCKCAFFIETLSKVSSFIFKHYAECQYSECHCAECHGAITVSHGSNEQ
jgi:hypothetical protein